MVEDCEKLRKFYFFLENVVRYRHVLVYIWPTLFDIPKFTIYYPTDVSGDSGSAACCINDGERGQLVRRMLYKYYGIDCCESRHVRGFRKYYGVGHTRTTSSHVQS